MSARDPHQHQAAKGIEFFYSTWHVARDHLLANRAASPLYFCKPWDSTYCLAFGSCFKYASQNASVSSFAHWNTSTRWLPPEKGAANPMCVPPSSSTSYLLPAGAFSNGLTSPNWLLAKWPEIARTVHKQHGHTKPIPRVRAQTHNAFSLQAITSPPQRPACRQNSAAPIFSRQQNSRASDQTSRISAKRVSTHADMPEIEFAAELRGKLFDMRQRIDNERNVFRAVLPCREDR